MLVYYGIYSNASRLRKQISVEEAGKAQEEGQGKTSEQLPHTGKLRAKKYWARLIEKIWKEDPFLCSNCGEESRIISFITQFAVIDKILKHIGYHHKDPPKPNYRGRHAMDPPKACKNPLG